MIPENKTSSKQSLDSLLDELLDNPSDIDISLIGDVHADSIRSSTISKGQADFLQLNDFIDKNNRLPSSSSDNHDEQKMARRMNAYAHNPADFNELRHLDKHGLIDKSRYQIPVDKPVLWYEDDLINSNDDVLTVQAETGSGSTEIETDITHEVEQLTDINNTSATTSIVDDDINNNWLEPIAVAPVNEQVMKEIPVTSIPTTIEKQEVEPSEIDNIEYKIVTIPVNSDVDALLLIEVDRTELSALFEAQGLSTSTPKRLASLKKPVVIGFKEKEVAGSIAAIEINEDVELSVELTETDDLSVASVSSTEAPKITPMEPSSLDITDTDDTSTPKEHEDSPDDQHYKNLDANGDGGDATNTEKGFTGSESCQVTGSLAVGEDNTAYAYLDDRDNTTNINENTHTSELVEEGGHVPTDLVFDGVYSCIGFSEEHEANKPEINSELVDTPVLDGASIESEKASQSTSRLTRSKPATPRDSGYSRVTVDDNFELIGQPSEANPVEQTTPQKADNEFTSIDDILDADDGFLESLCEAEEMYFDMDNKYTETDDRATPDEVGKQTPCSNFYMYEARFKELHAKLKSNELKTVDYTVTNIKEGDAFILNGMVGFIESIGEYRETTSGNYDSRLRLIFDNGTESNILLRSLSRALYMDKTSRLIVRSADDFTDFEPHGSVSKVKTGQVYIVKSLSANPRLRQVRNLHKIGFTKHTVEDRIKNANNDIAFLESPVEVVEKIDCYDLDPRGLEGCIHDFLHYQRVNITLTSRHGKSYKPKEWFSINIDDAKKIVACIVDGSIVNYRMDNITNRMVERKM